MLMRRSNWKKDAVFLPGRTFRKIGTNFWRSSDAAMFVSRPAANETVGLLIGERLVPIGILLDQRSSRVVDVSEFRGILFVHRPELGRFTVGERQIRGNELLFDRPDVFADECQLLVRKRLGTAAGWD
jgi:hypothetical protein